MKSGGLLLLAGSLALWAGLLAAPPQNPQKRVAQIPGTGSGNPTSTENSLPGSGHTIHTRPTSAAGHLAHVGPASGEKPSSNSGPVAGEKPTSGEKPSSLVGQEERPSANKPTSSEKPEHGEKHEAKKEKEAEEKDKTEDDDDEEEENLFGDDDDDGEEEREKGKADEEGAQEGNKEGDDAFDSELDYGLNKPPFDAYSYHDGWSDEGAKETNVGLMGEMAALPEAGDASNNDGEPILDAWGDLVGGSSP